MGKATLVLLFCSLQSWNGGVTSALSAVVAPQQLNFSLRSAALAGIHIKETKEMGLGAFTSVHVPVGTMLGEYSGELITDYESQTRYCNSDKKHEMLECDRQWARSRQQRSQTTTGTYLFDMGNGISVDAEDTDVSGWCRYMNSANENAHECNVRPSNYKRNGVGIHKPRFFATRDIEAGEELMYNYGEAYWENHKTE